MKSDLLKSGAGIACGLVMINLLLISSTNAELRLETLSPTAEQPYIINVNGEKQQLYKQSHALVITISNYKSEKITGMICPILKKRVIY